MSFFFFLALWCRKPLCVLFVTSVFNYHLLQWLMERQSNAREHLSVRFFFSYLCVYVKLCGFFLSMHPCMFLSVCFFSIYCLHCSSPTAKMFGGLKRKNKKTWMDMELQLDSSSLTRREDNGAPRPSDTSKLEVDGRDIPQLVTISCFFKAGNKKPMWNLIGRRYSIQTSSHTAQFQQNLTSELFFRSRFPDYRSPGCWVFFHPQEIAQGVPTLCPTLMELQSRFAALLSSPEIVCWLQRPGHRWSHEWLIRLITGDVIHCQPLTTTKRCVMCH